MHWQDIVLSVGSFIFAFALLPSVFTQDKPAFSTSLMNGSVLTAFVIAYVTLTFWLAAIATGLTATLWFTLAAQKYRHD